MTILATSGWDDYEFLDSGEGYRLERFGKYLISKPDPQAIWQRRLSREEWELADATYEKGGWVRRTEVPESWRLTYGNISFNARLTPFKHTGVFPEQHLHWDFITQKIIQSQKDVAILNLFGYTGMASIVAAAAGARVTHVDASKPAIAWARENQKASGLEEKPIRWILEDALKFVEREVRRGNKYDGIIMDPPIYGHGPTGEIWDFPKSFPELMNACSQVLSERPLFVITNAYAISSSALMLENVMRDSLKSGNIEVGELALKEKSGERLLSTGIFARWVV